MLFDRLDPRPDDLLVFVHVRKTAGTSVLRMFRQALGEERCRQLPMQAIEGYATGWRGAHDAWRRRLMLARDNLREDLKRRLGRPNTSLATTAWVGGHVRLGGIAPPGRRVLALTLLREPIDRFTSEFHMIRRGRERYRLGPLADPRKALAFAEDFPSYVDMVLDRQAELPLNGQCRYFAAQGGFAAAKAAIDERVFLAGVTERFDDYFDLLGRRLGLSFGPAVRENVRAADQTPPTLPAPLRSRLEAALADDIALHDHVRTGFAALWDRRAA